MKKKHTPCGGSGKPPVARYEQVGICSDCGVRTFLDGDGSEEAPYVIHSHLGSRTDVMDFTGVRDTQREVNRRVRQPV
jgi:hypothetical protein